MGGGGPAVREREDLASTPTRDLAVVRLRRFPLRVWARAHEHHEELLREFALLALDAQRSPGAVPARLVALVARLQERYAAVVAAPTEAREAALARGERETELVYEVPPTAAAAAQELGALLEEADEFCARGQLLTLASRPEVVAFRRWFVEEFTRQVAGGAPRPWPGPLD